MCVVQISSAERIKLQMRFEPGRREVAMNQLVEYIMIGGTIILLGGAVAAILVASVIGIYVKARFGLMEVRRFQTYARHEAPPFYWVARSWSRNLLITTFALVLLEIVFMFVMFKFFYNPESVERTSHDNGAAALTA
jgi:hypothetical protein